MEQNTYAENSTPNWTNEQYHADTTHISKSGVCLVNKTPANYYHAYLNPLRKPRQETPAMRIGSAVHCAVLEPQLFESQYGHFDDTAKIEEIGGGNPRGTKVYKEWKENFFRENTDKIFLTDAEMELCNNVRDAVLAHPTAARLLNAPGKVEQTFLFNEPVSGAPCKIRPDRYSELDGDVYIVDLKTTEDASPDQFARSAYNYKYDVQAPFYLDGFEYATGVRPEAFVFIAVEKEAPYNVAVYFAPDEMLELGRKKYRAGCQTYAECLATGVWPGYDTDVKTLKLPAYAFTK